MALKNYTIGKALRVEKANDPSTAVEYLFGSGAPGGDTGEQDDAPIGSSYNRLDSPFNTYKKIADANSTADWVAMSLVAQDPETDVVVTGTGLTTATEIDCVNVDAYDSAEWEVSVFPTDAADDEKKEKFKVSALHNGSASADATIVDHDIFSKLKVGAAFDLTVDVVLTGAAGAQEFCLQLTSTEGSGVSYTARRTNLG